MDNTNTLISKISNCNRCAKVNTRNALCINSKEIGLKYCSDIKIPINILFLAESPPAPYAGFFYDPNCENNRFRNKLFDLINRAGLSEVNNLTDFTSKGCYLADAIKCRWDNSRHNYISNQILNNCSEYLVKEIEMLKPKHIVLMGKTAKRIVTLRNIKETLQIHGISLTYISFILTASNETDDERIGKLSEINIT